MSIEELQFTEKIHFRKGNTLDNNFNTYKIP